MTPKRDRLTIELLCAHHQLNGFDCGIDELNTEIARRCRPNFDPDEGVTYVATEDDAILGFLVVTDMELALEPPDDARRFFYLAYLGVDQRSQNAEVGNQLVLRAAELRKQRANRRKLYYATLINTFHIPQLEPKLEGMGFERVPSNQYLWYRKKR